MSFAPEFFFGQQDAAVDAEIAIGCDSFAASAAFIEFDRLHSWQVVNQLQSTIRTASDSW